MTDDKKCNKCELTKPVELFGKQKHGTNGLRSWCRECCRKYDQQRRRANPELFRQRFSAWEHANPEKKRQRNLKYRPSPDRLRERNRQRKALKRGARIETYRDLDIFERDRWVCQLCHRRVNRRLSWPHPLSQSIDHIIPLSIGGADCAANVQLTHLHCNLSKNIAARGEQMRLL